MDRVNREQDEDQQAVLPKSRQDISSLENGSQKVTSASKSYLRLGLEIVMAAIIGVLLIRPFPDRATTKSSPVPRFPRKSYTFLENPRYLNEGMFDSREKTLHTLHNWIELSADGRGYVKIEDSDSFDLGDPYSIQMNITHSEPVYMMSVFHQLHCLSYLVQTLQTAFDKKELIQEVAHHSAHCFDYLRQSILCAADTSLEGKTEAGPGWGSKHDCPDYDAVLAWANERTVVRFRGNMPDEAVL
ncbi:Uncharacterized protein BP5553_06632 [Venustampulla echinocandica]|uniref:Oxidase ustYa n=1 Tax=Venustampulla echinocandica TaxID=2656787 RepID=A0A370TKG8_9HELO|nr:Uncharacterized protein BP5553_06632 [Venustampulla echinocandica]RDL36020.1 Uncharacterized protein BP5553_06632 [Venustampulla echinocandica]